MSLCKFSVIKIILNDLYHQNIRKPTIKMLRVDMCSKAFNSFHT